MLKSISVFIVAVMLLITCVGCGASSRNERKDNKPIKSVLDECINETYSEDNSLYWKNFSYDGRYNFEAGTFDNMLADLSLQKIKIELTCLTETDGGYAVLRMHDDKIGDYYVYFFCRFRSINQDRADYDNWEFAGRAMRVSKRISAKDFDGIKKGATLKDVSKVDPVTLVSLPEEDYLGTDQILSIDTFHYTENDGILRITFKRKSVNDEFLVSELDIDPTYEVKWVYGTDIQCDETIKQKIKPEHLPD